MNRQNNWSYEAYILIVETVNKVSKIHSVLQNDKFYGEKGSKGGGQEVAEAQGEGETEELEMNGCQITVEVRGEKLKFTLYTCSLGKIVCRR